MNGFFVNMYHEYFCDAMRSSGRDPGMRKPYHAVQSVQVRRE